MERVVEGGGSLMRIVAHSITFLLAGYETIANTLAYTSYLLALNPEIQEKLRAKFDEYFESNLVSWHSLISRPSTPPDLDHLQYSKMEGEGLGSHSALPVA